MEETKLPNRQSIRKRGWNYTAPGWYFLTTNTHESRALFGVIVNGRMVLSEADCGELLAHFIRSDP